MKIQGNKSLNTKRYLLRLWVMCVITFLVILLGWKDDSTLMLLILLVGPAFIYTIYGRITFLELNKIYWLWFPLIILFFIPLNRYIFFLLFYALVLWVKRDFLSDMEWNVTSLWKFIYEKIPLYSATVVIKKGFWLIISILPVGFFWIWAAAATWRDPNSIFSKIIVFWPPLVYIGAFLYLAISYYKYVQSNKELLTSKK